MVPQDAPQRVFNSLYCGTTRAEVKVQGSEPCPWTLYPVFRAPVPEQITDVAILWGGCLETTVGEFHLLWAKLFVP